MKFNNLLQQADYSLVLPQHNIKPLDLLHRKESSFFSQLFFEELDAKPLNASMKDMFIYEGRQSIYPKIKTSKLPSELNGHDLLSTKSNFITKLLSSELAINSKLNAVSRVLFSFENAIETSVNLVQLDEFLEFSTIKKTLPNTLEQLKAGNIFIVVATLTATKFNIQSADDFMIQGGISDKELLSYLELKVAAGLEKKKIFEISHQENKPMTFAIKTANIKFIKNSYKIIHSQVRVRNNDELNVEYLKGCSEVVII